MKHLLACVCLLLSSYTFACQVDNPRICSQQIMELLNTRTQAIQGAFGDTSFALPATLQVKFVGLSDPERKWLGSTIHYDSQEKRLFIPRAISTAAVPIPLRSTLFYWPFYVDEKLRTMYPVVEAIDNALWSVFLQEAALSSGHAWPHSNCNTADAAKRVPCRMMLSAAARFVKVRRDPMFNENRLDRIWPTQFSALTKRNLSEDDSAYADVLRFGGVLLMRPLIAEFGVPRVLAYIASHPLEIEGDSMHQSALRYQERAREALSLSRKSQTYAQLPDRRDDAG